MVKQRLRLFILMALDIGDRCLRIQSRVLAQEHTPLLRGRQTAHDEFNLRDCLCLLLARARKITTYAREAAACCTRLCNPQWSMLLLIQCQGLLQPGCRLVELSFSKMGK